ncbi:hypothetical protein H0H81_012263 [Sphagnurus paluster]|uniref:Uncharacterized protein n=1 Tax=Sphagnurus paluster TaxID=117069 RepID=A0A9P7GMW3_9AGAR|nr:hypothetical protein H0H81_012263 [Sphagnurus paluster]
MSYVIFGRAIKNEHLALGIFTTVFGGAALAMRGDKKEKAPLAGQSLQQVKESVPINAGSRCVYCMSVAVHRADEALVHAVRRSNCTCLCVVYGAVTDCPA